MKKSIKSLAVLIGICAFVAVIIALTNSITAPIIEANEAKKSNEALLEVLPEGGSFDLVDISEKQLPESVNEVYRAANGGYVVKLTVSGYAPGMVIVCGVNSDGTVSGSKLVSSGETPSIGGTAAEKFKSAVIGKTVSDIETVDTIASATKTTLGYRNAIKDALNTVVILGGGEVDLRSEEEILADNLSAALPAGEGKFTKYFFVEAVDGIDAIYTADNESGAVCVIGEDFIGISADGNVLAECSEETASLVKTAITTINSTVMSEIDLTAFEGLPSRLVSAKLTQSGNYVLEMEGAGYGITGGDEYHPASGEYILIRVSIGADGKILDCLTLSQAETKGIGDACAHESFYGQFDGKTEENCNEIDAISGATLTTDGYKKAISRAFESVKILKGGN